MPRAIGGPYRVSRAAVELRAVSDWLRLNPSHWDLYQVSDGVVLHLRRFGTPSEAGRELERLRANDGTGFIIETTRVQYDPADH